MWPMQPICRATNVAASRFYEWFNRSASEHSLINAKFMVISNLPFHLDGVQTFNVCASQHEGFQLRGEQLANVAVQMQGQSGQHVVEVHVRVNGH
jgi:hypothetical protein